MAHFYSFLVSLLFVIDAFAVVYDYEKFRETSPLNYEVFVELMDTGNVTSVEQALALLKSSYPGHFAHYILMYKSRSLQESSFLYPRAIMFDKSAQFVFSFNGNPRHRGYNRIEIMQYRPDTFSFEFREVIFPKGGGKPDYSDANPSKCMACHQSTERKVSDPRPNWEPYNTWIGAYGSINGDLEFSEYDRAEMEKRGAHQSVIQDATLEKKMKDRFFSQIQPEDSRYKHLGSELDFNPKDNTTVTQFFGNLNFRRVVRLATSIDPDLYKYLKVPFLTLVKCHRLAMGHDALKWAVRDLESRSIRLSQFESRKPKSEGELHYEAKKILRAESSEWTNEELLKMVESRRRYWNQVDQESPQVNVSDGIALLFEPFGVNTSDWSMDFQTDGHLAFVEKFGLPGFARGSLRNAYEAVLGRERLGSKESCEQLVDESIEKIEKLRASQLYQDILAKKLAKKKATIFDLKARCVKCHTDKSDPFIPLFPLRNDKLMSKALNQPSELNPKNSLFEEIEYRLSDFPTNTERMPMGPVVDRKLRRELVEHFKELANEGPK